MIDIDSLSIFIYGYSSTSSDQGYVSYICFNFLYRKVSWPWMNFNDVVSSSRCFLRTVLRLKIRNEAPVESVKLRRELIFMK